MTVKILGKRIPNIVAYGKYVT